MANHNECARFNDVHEEPGNQTSDEERKKLVERNEENARIYAAVREVLEKDFAIKSMPQKPEQFPGGLKGKELAQISAILGIIHADNWKDPSNGKKSPNTDDIVGEGGTVIDRRFIDAVVDAIKEYTAASDLFNNVFELMIAEAAEGVSPARSPGSSKG